MKRAFKLLFLALILVLIVNLVGRPLSSVQATGAQWSRTMENVPARVPALVYAVWGSSARDVYAIGETVGAPLLFHNDGSGWSNASPALPAGWHAIHLFGIWGFSASDVYAVGAGFDTAWNQVPLLDHNDGTGWTANGLSLPAGWDYGHLLSMWGSSASDIYTVGWAYNAVGYRMPLLYHNDGTGWTEAALSLPVGWLDGQLFGIWGSSANDIYAVGQGVDEFGEAFPLFYHNDGSGWHEASPSLPAEWKLNHLPIYGVWGVWGSSASDIYVVGNALDAVGNQVPLLYHNDGSGWHEASPSLPAEWSRAYLRSVWGSSASDVYTVGAGYDASGQYFPRLYHNDGTGWTASVLSLPDGWSNGGLNSVWGSSASDIYAVGSSDDGPLLYHNDGTGWTEIATPAIIYVDQNATGANNGISWANAYTDLQSALAAASAGDEIWVAAGTYKPTTGTDRTISFTLKNGVAIYGGFAGTETLRTQRDFEMNFTLLSGDIGVLNDRSDNSFHVLVGGSLNPTTVLDGFTISDGNANEVVDYGGGLYNGGWLGASNPTLSNLIFSNNFASYQGGGLYNQSASHPTLLNVTFSSNSAEYGGGMYNGLDCKPALTNVIFSNNSVDMLGGGLYNGSASNPTLTKVTFSGNSAGAGGGMANLGSSPTLTDVKFRNNSGYEGGALFNESASNPILVNVAFSGNSADYGGGIYNRLNSSPVLTNVTFSGNSAGKGGGMYNYTSSNLTLTNVTFSDNEASVGGGIYNDGSDSIINNSIFYGNIGGEINNQPGAATVTNSIVQGGYPGTDNLDVDPLLGLLQDNGGFTQTMALGAGSPAINAGDDANCPATDQRGMTRPQGSHCDMGAFEYVFPPTATSTNTPSSTPTNTVTASSTHTPTPTASNTPTVTVTYTPTRTPTYTPTLPSTATNTATPTASTASNTSIFTATKTAMFTNLDFSDVPSTYWAWNFVERLYSAGITGGCALNPLQYCPEATVTRAQMAVFLERGVHGSSYNPPAMGGSTGFGDVTTTYWAAAWIKQLATESITGGCGSGNYCPESPVTRAQMAIFLLRSKHGASYSPPAAGGSTGFLDVDPTYWVGAWIKQLVAEGITAGCGSGNYCPEAPVTRAQMAVFLVRTFNLP